MKKKQQDCLPLREMKLNTWKGAEAPFFIIFPATLQIKTFSLVFDTTRENLDLRSLQFVLFLV